MKVEDFRNVIGEEKFQSVEETKLKLDEINYENLYKNYEKGKLFLPQDEVDSMCPVDDLSSLTSGNNALIEAYNRTRDILENYDQTVHIGTVSNGVHSLDFIQRMDRDVIDYISENVGWNDTRVMFVQEAPSNNLLWSAGYGKHGASISLSEYLQNYNEYDNLESCMTRHWWRVDDSDTPLKKSQWDYANEPFKFMEERGQYSSEIYSLIVNFGLANLYTTNLIRFELFRNEEGSEKFLNWSNMMAVTKQKNKKRNSNSREILKTSFDHVFLKEVEAFKPSVIFATANPYNYLVSLEEFKDYRNKLRKVIHSANPNVAKDLRLCFNTCGIIKELYETDIIDERTAVNYIKRYLNQNRPYIG